MGENMTVKDKQSLSLTRRSLLGGAAALSTASVLKQLAHQTQTRIICLRMYQNGHRIWAQVLTPIRTGCHLNLNHMWSAGMLNG